MHERPVVRALTPQFGVFGDFHVASASGLTYEVEIRDISARQFACTCADYRQNRLGTCKHIEAVLFSLESRGKRRFAEQARKGSPRIDIVAADGEDALCVERNGHRLPQACRRLFGGNDGLSRDADPALAVERLREAAAVDPGIRVSVTVAPWLERRMRREERLLLRRDYEAKVHEGVYPTHETTVPLYPYQREGMLHLAFTERALLADEMGLGKTIQAVAACALLNRLGKARRVLVVTPASLKGEWEEQIQRFTTLESRPVFGPRPARVRVYRNPPFFTIVNYEQVRTDALDINEYLKPDVVVLDEAQRIKNWPSATARSVKRLESRYAFILTGTPIENRIDELYSLVDFLDPHVFGPLFRFNREFYEFDGETGRAIGYRNLREMHERISSLMLRRRKADVETELPARTDRNLFVALTKLQRSAYEDHLDQVARLVAISKKRPLTKEQQDKLMRELNMMRMICDTEAILGAAGADCPKLPEIQGILEDCLAEDGVKVIIFSEWVKMLELIRDWLKKRGLGYAWHTGSVPQQKRRAEIRAFKEDAACRVFLCTESGSAGLNLQVASVVINCDLPWNPAKLEQRIARAWRKHQKRAVTVINLVAENTIEHAMLATLAVKRDLADGVLDLRGNLDTISLKSGGQAFLKRIQHVLSAVPVEAPADQPGDSLPPAAERAECFARRCHDLLDGSLVACEEHFPLEGNHSTIVVVVERDASSWRPRLSAIHELFFGEKKWDPLSPVQLQVVDRATIDALDHLERAGLLLRTTRATRPLLPSGAGGPARPALSAAQLERVTALRSEAARQSKMADVLRAAGFEAESRAPAGEAALAEAKATAVEHSLPEPRDAAEAALPPVCHILAPGLLVRLKDTTR